MKRIHFVIVALLAMMTFNLNSCTKVTTPAGDVVIIEPEDKIAPVVGVWNFVRLIGLEEDGITEYDIDAKIMELKKKQNAGGLSTEELHDIYYQLVRLEGVIEKEANRRYVFEDGGVGRIEYKNGAFSDSDFVWEDLGNNVFSFDYGGDYHIKHNLHIAANNCSAYFMYRDYDVEGPNLKCFVEKEI